MILARACRRAVRGRGGRPTGPPSSRRASAAAAVAVRYDEPPAVRRDGLHRFLGRELDLAILPTPLPQDYTSEINDYWFSDSSTQELLAVMAACLHNLYDVPRAKGIFDRLRTKSSASLEPRAINAMLDAYLKMASRSETDYWLDALWELFDAYPEASPATYATMLLAAHRFPDCQYADGRGIKWLLGKAIENEIPIKSLISDQVFTDDEEAAAIIQELSKAAVILNIPHIVLELTEAEALGSGETDGIDDPKPVRKADDSIPFNLDTLRKHLARVALARRVLPTDLTARQRLLEDSVYDAAEERLRKQNEIFEKLGLDETKLLQPDLQRWMWQWHCRLKDRLETEITEIVNSEKNRRESIKRKPVLAPYLSLVKAEKLSMLTVVEIMRLHGTGGVADGMKTARALISVGKAVEAEFKARMCKTNHINLPTQQPPRDYFSKMGYHSLWERRVAAARLMQDNEGWTAPWTQALRSQIGGVLVGCLMDVAEVPRTAKAKHSDELITEDQPAFYQSYEYQRGQKLGVIRLNPVVSQRLSKDRVVVHPRHLPMLVKPKPWVSYNEGGYLKNKTQVMRFKDNIEQKSYLKYASEQGHVELVYAGLDVLGSTPWKINRRVFDVVLSVWNSGERLGKMPPAVYDEPEPEAPPEQEDLAMRNVYLTRMRAYNQSKAANHSDRCSVNYKIEISRAFLNDSFYLPHNVDFRGRAYPVPPHLNHIGDDLSRGLLMFAEKRKLTARGFRWLKIHLANLYGFDKANFDERVAFTEAHIEDVYDSALNPLTGRGWWQGADDPWQCLATCMEVYSAIESGDPDSYECALPVHQDGTCNGLQHYAALGGDNQGAAQVNLSAGDRPSDVYSFVGNMVEKVLAEEAAKGERYAILLSGKVSRKVVKQTVMTTVYGVTFIGARDQIEKQLKDRKDIPEEECWLAASYLAKKVLSAIGDLFTGAKHIQTWLNLCARLISKSIPQERIPEALGEHTENQKKKRRKKSDSDEAGSDKAKLTLPDKSLKKEQMTSVVWTTPLGLPICQPYRKVARKQIFTALQTVYISDPGAPAEVNSMKQASAFPPNFIHSLDATHMMLTAIECRVQGLTFASVHDSYWTHACSIDQMSEIIRETFIALHSSDVLGNLEEEFKKRYAGFLVPLLNLRNGQLVKMLHDAGVRLHVKPEQATNLQSIKDLLVVSEDEPSTVETKKVYGDLEGLIEQLQHLEPEASVAADGIDDEEVDAEDTVSEPQPKKRQRKTKKMAEQERAGEEQLRKLVDQLVSADTPFDLDKAQAAKARTKQLEDARTLAELLGKFVKLTDLLPPLPKKGTFEVARIKDSPYFFS
ncbi:DNA/RNA polymerase [Mycena belliarum]|uniref:DNA-directed RNA polymerase n=1 Tax=Mycena belliarum TaxID=1033014 RepID=A0AAD6TW84_9AGAR|nr:DNA/RNA polymerase [Mycena belliae]